MTTHTLTGFKVTSSGPNATAVSAATLTLITSETFNFTYSMDAASNSGYSSITLTPAFGSRLTSAVINGTRFVMNDKASIADVFWVQGEDDGMITTMLMIDLGVANEKFYIPLGNSNLPAIGTSHSAYNAWMASVFKTTSVIDSRNPLRPGAMLNLSRFEDAGLISNLADNIVGNATFDNWSTKSLQLFAAGGNDTVTGLAGVDFIDAGTGNDSVSGLAGNDVIAGLDGNDTLNGGDGNDSLAGGRDHDLLNGDAGNDTLSGSDGNDTANGGDGVDKITLDAGNDVSNAGAGADKVDGGLGNDTIDGGADADSLVGGVGADSLVGGTGNDTLNGGEGNDKLIGGDGNDSMIGGAGIDFFYFSDTNDADKITDFRDNQDTIYINDDLGVTTVSQALSKADQVGRNVVFDFGGGDTLTVMNTKLSALVNDITIF